MMDGLDWRIVVTTSVLSILMVSQCAGKARAAYREVAAYNAAAISEATSPPSYPVNPYVFSAEDYDLLQHAESSEGARSIVSYEPQRINDAAASGRSSSEMSLEWSSTFAPSTTQQQQQLPPERKFHEVSRKRSSRIRGEVGPRNETSPAYQRRRVVTAATTTTTTTTTTKPRVLQTRRRRSRITKNNNMDEIIDQQAAGLMFVLNDRLPRPFGFTTEPSFTTRILPPQQYNHRPASTEVVSERPKPTVVSRRASTEVLTTQSPPIVYTIPKRRRAQSTSPLPAQQATPAQTEPTHETVVPLERNQSEELITAVPGEKRIVDTDVPIVEELDYDEPPTEPAPPKDDDRHEYNYSHVERYDEPLLQESTKEDEEPVDDADQAGDQIVPVAEVQDLVTEGDHHHKAHHKAHKAHKHHHEEGEEGGSAEHDSGEHHEEGDKAHKGYKNYHEHEDGEKGHHTKEGHDRHYDEEDGDAKMHHDEAAYHEERVHGEAGEKKKAFHEKGKHNKGHSTKGEHVVHKKDEFEKKIEFYDESHEGGDDEKEGAQHHDHHHKKGHHHKKAHHHKGHEEAHRGHKGHHDKGHHHHTKKGHHKEEGEDHHHHHEEKYGKKGGHEDAKHWHHHKKGKRR